MCSFALDPLVLDESQAQRRRLRPRRVVAQPAGLDDESALRVPADAARVHAQQLCSERMRRPVLYRRHQPGRSARLHDRCPEARAAG